MGHCRDPASSSSALRSAQGYLVGMDRLLRCRAAFAATGFAVAGVLILTVPAALGGSSAAGATRATGPYSGTCAHAPTPLPAGESLTVGGNQLMAGGKCFVV